MGEPEYERKDAPPDSWRVCRHQACSNNVFNVEDTRENPTHCPECDGKGDSLWVQQRDLTFHEEAHIASACSLDNGRLDPGRVLDRLLEFTVNDSNFLAFVDNDGPGLNERNFGWWLYSFLGGPDLTRRLLGDASEQLEDLEERKKKSSDS